MAEPGRSVSTWPSSSLLRLSSALLLSDDCDLALNADPILELFPVMADTGLDLLLLPFSLMLADDGLLSPLSKLDLAGAGLLSPISELDLAESGLLSALSELDLAEAGLLTSLLEPDLAESGLLSALS